MSTFNVQKWKSDCYSAMNDDFNTPILISHLFEAVKIINQIKEQNATLTIDDLSELKKTMNAFFVS